MILLFQMLLKRKDKRTIVAFPTMTSSVFFRLPVGKFSESVQSHKLDSPLEQRHRLPSS